MKKTLLLLLVIFFSLFVFIRPAKADYQSSYNDYQYQYGLYRQTFQDYTVAKAQYVTYNTLNSQYTAMDKLRAVLKQRNKLIISYYQLLREKMRMVAGLTQDQITTFDGLASTETAFLINNSNLVDAAGNFQDLNAASSKFDNQYGQMDVEAKQTIGQILIAKTDFEASKLGDLFSRTNGLLDRLQSMNIDPSDYRRQITSAQSKLDLYSAQKSAAMAILYPAQYNNQPIDLLKAESNIIDGRQYLHETGSYLMEILQALTHQ